MKSKTTSILLSAGLCVLLAAGCQRDEAVLKATISPFANNGKVILDEDVWPAFEAGDIIKINGNDVTLPSGGQNVRFIIERDLSGYRAVYPASFVTAMEGNTVSLDIPRVQEYAFDATTNAQRIQAPMGAINNGNKLPFTNMGSLLAVTFTMKNVTDPVTIDSIQVVSSRASLWGSATVQDISSSDRYFSIASTGEQYRTVSLAGSQNSSSETGYNSLGDIVNDTKTYYVSLPMIDDDYDNRFTVNIYITTDGTHKVLTKEQANAYGGCMMQNTYAKMSFSVSLRDQYDIPACIDGRYSIGIYNGSATYNGQSLAGDTIKCEFDPRGNLQVYVDANGVPTNTWRVATHQWDLIENHKTTDTVDANLTLSNGWVDLFGYSVKRGDDVNNRTDGLPFNASDNNWGISTSTSTSDYYGDFVDWGANPNIEGTLTRDTNIYFTLTAGEWGFLLSYSDNHRLNASSRWAGGNKNKSGGSKGGGGSTVDGGCAVAGVPGVIFLPDRWEWSGDLANMHTNYKIKSIYTPNEWKVMEAAGAIFLPSGRQRNGTSYIAKDNGGLYATSSYDNPQHAVHNHNHSGDGIYYGLSVRLARYPVIVHHSDKDHPYGPTDQVHVIRLTSIYDGHVTVGSSKSRHARR